MNTLYVHKEHLWYVCILLDSSSRCVLALMLWHIEVACTIHYEVHT